MSRPSWKFFFPLFFKSKGFLKLLTIKISGKHDVSTVLQSLSVNGKIELYKPYINARKKYKKFAGVNGQ